MNTLSIEQLHQKFKTLSKDEVILDIRGPEEFADGHIPGAKNIPHGEVTEHAAELKKYKHIYMHCRSGRRVQIAAELLTRAGITQFSGVTQGGMPDWQDAGYPVEK